MQEDGPKLLSTQPSTKRMSRWVPFAAFAGTTVALAIPLFVLARQRKAALKNALNSAPPPRRSGTMSSGSIGRKPDAPSQMTTAEPSTEEYRSPRTGELLSAISKTDFNTALYAGKAFVIATGIVTISATALTLGIKTAMGVQDTREFAQRMRLYVWRRLPGLTSRIHRPELDDDGLPIASSLEPDLDWNLEDAEKRIKTAYDEGGFPAWIRAAAKEMEAELNVERALRQREYNRPQVEGTVQPSSDPAV